MGRVGTVATKSALRVYEKSLEKNSGVSRTESARKRSAYPRARARSTFVLKQLSNQYIAVGVELRKTTCTRSG